MINCMKLVSMQELCGAAAALAEDVLCDGGVFLCKALQGTHIPGVCVCVGVCIGCLCVSLWMQVF